MPAIPEFVLRKLFVPGSLKPVEGGFTFALNNTFAPVTKGVPAVTSPASLLTRRTWSNDTSPPASPALWPSMAMMAPGSTRNWRPEA